MISIAAIRYLGILVFVPGCCGNANAELYGMQGGSGNVTGQATGHDGGALQEQALHLAECWPRWPSKPSCGVGVGNSSNKLLSSDLSTDRLNMTATEEWHEYG